MTLRDTHVQHTDRPALHPLHNLRIGPLAPQFGQHAGVKQIAQSLTLRAGLRSRGDSGSSEQYSGDLRIKATKDPAAPLRRA